MRQRLSDLATAAIVAVTLMLTPAVLEAQQAQEETDAAEKVSFVDALKGGTVKVDLRYRFELVDQANFDDNGLASTLRTALGYSTKPFKGFNVFLQAENVTNIGAADDHNNVGFGDSGNGVTNRPVIADPPGTQMLQALLQYQGGGSTLKLGRQEIIYDDARFVGNVGFRQHHQALRSFRFTNQSIDNLSFNYAYVDRVYRITRARADTNTHLLNAQYRIADIGSITGYGYILRYDAEGLKRLDTNTFGGEFKGQRDVGAKGSIRYEIEYAGQSEAGENPRRVSADYLHFMGGGNYSGFGFRVGWEKLGGSVADGQFQTPLATLHAFNGWADKFLATPTNGLEDLYFRVDGPLGPVRWILVYHEFKAATGSSQYGNEFDFQVTYRAPWNELFGFRGAIYNAEDFSVDTTKIWLYTGYAF